MKTTKLLWLFLLLLVAQTGAGQNQLGSNLNE